jgi:putative acetyltransferase
MPTPQDAEALYALFADPEVMRGLGKEPVSALDDARAMIDDAIGGWRTERLGPFILETATDRHVVGQAGLMVFDARDWTPSSWATAGPHAQPELGWALIRAHWGHGYATEAAAAIRDWAYQRRSIDGLVSLIPPANIRSQRVAQRLGAIPSATVTPAGSERETVVWRHPHDAEWRIRRARADDHVALVELWERSVRATHGFLSEDDVVELRPQVDAALRDRALELWVLTVDDDAPAGFMGLAGDDIAALFLDPRRRGRGGGRRLVEHAQALRGGELTADVNEQNPEARGFYEALGFVVEGRSALDDAGRPFPLLHMRRPGA